MKIWSYSFLLILVIGAGMMYTLSEDDKVISLTDEKIQNEEQSIPEQAVRLRILANSDSVQDQMVKRKIRDEVIKEIKSWTVKPKTIDEARAMISERLPLFEKIANETIANQGYTYQAKVDFGEVPFPTKLYGDQIYPAGNYEALRITVGAGNGDNWWCVLFPPLCFVDMETGDAVQEESVSGSLSASISSDPQMYAAAQKQLKQARKQGVEVDFLLLKWLKDAE
ncbi:stage II sporulation protein R [Hazenella sp. IB182357]|uniref:Stage II sporulation protein R n=1 Tax=Polycladospora coralii TaxID=2771432 RepID=A0A926NAM0_9BACL|nr:stage II sporulation protein R [Polycladospora coralii]MBD1372115.1 stage II sporulation protein R [Polycladospora coralii]MBS7530621.1 stage II sporulation protein R [Polycladospora coralii]